VAIKPSFGRVSCHGILPTSWSSDHPGIVVRSVADAALVLQAIARHDPRDPYSQEQPSVDFVSATTEAGRPPRLGLVRDLLDRADPLVRAAAEATIERLARSGAEVREVRLPEPMDFLLAIHGIVHNAEGAAIHAERHARLAEHYLPSVRANVEAGLLLPAALYLTALRLRRRTREPMVDLASSVEALVAPTAPDLPPKIVGGPKHHPLGDPSFQAVWTSYGLPNITLPTGIGSMNLPHAIQLIGRPFGERDLLQTAAWCEAILEPLPSSL
jgi:aspartyl-tRNA(Asn)/glutamyl-tRNA(Gln) amidotransferase subunit A